MAKFNTPESVKKIENESITSSVIGHKDFTLNYEGGVAYDLNKYTELYTRVASCLVNEPKFYGKKGDTEKRILELVKEIAKENPEFPLKLAVYARQRLYLRSIPIVLLAECSLINESKKYVRAYSPDIIRRADELKETVAYLIGKIGQIGGGGSKADGKGNGSLPAGIKKGLADSFSNFNAYQFAKYDSRTDVVKLRDVLRLVHPKPQSEEQSQLFKNLKNGTLPVPETWETIISSKGSTKENWEYAVTVMPIMALIRNLRNLLQHNISNWNVVQNKLTDQKIILNSKQFPFRFLNAYREIEDQSNLQTRQVMEWLEQAMDISVANIPKWDGVTAVFADNSGSMSSPMSVRSKGKQISSKTRNYDISNLFMAMIDKRCENSICGIFGTNFAVKRFPLRSGILQNADSIINDEVGSSTNAYLSINYLNNHKIKVDRIVVITDEQCYDSSSGWSYVGQSLHESLLRYRRNVNPNAFIYTIDLGGYGTTQIPEDTPNAAVFAGFSDKILTFITAFEQDKSTALKEIEAITPRGKRIWKAKEDKHEIATKIVDNVDKDEHEETEG
jgi:60 kDa SS-A/Ro ribonucleoprotein